MKQKFTRLVAVSAMTVALAGVMHCLNMENSQVANAQPTRLRPGHCAAIG